MDEDKLLSIIEENNKKIKEYEEKFSIIYDEIKQLKEELYLNKYGVINRNIKESSTIHIEVKESNSEENIESFTLNVGRDKEKGLNLKGNEEKNYTDELELTEAICSKDKVNIEETKEYESDETIEISENIEDDVDENEIVEDFEEDKDMEEYKDIDIEENEVIEEDEFNEEDEVHEGEAIQLESEVELFDQLKDSFIHNKSDDIKEILSRIIENMKVLENSFTDDDLLILIYLAYFNEKLDELLNCSTKITEYHARESLELDLLRKVDNEKKCLLNTTVKECVYSFMRIHYRKLFANYDIILKIRIIEKVNTIAFRTFEDVRTVEEIESGVVTENIRAWVNLENKLLWVLVDGLYSSDRDELYMLESAIYILKVNRHIVTDEEKNIIREENKLSTKVDEDKVISRDIIESIEEEYDDDDDKKMKFGNGLIKVINSLFHKK